MRHRVKGIRSCRDVHRQYESVGLGRATVVVFSNSGNSRAYRIHTPTPRRVVECRNVIFIESVDVTLPPGNGDSDIDCEPDSASSDISGSGGGDNEHIILDVEGSAITTQEEGDDI